MSNHLAIATVTATLQRLLQSVVQRDVDGARVTTLKPNSIGNSTPESGVNLFLYKINHNSALRNTDRASFRSRKGEAIRRRSSLDLFYMLSAYGNDTELEPQRLIGSVVRTLSDKTVLTHEMVNHAIADAAYLNDSDLATQTQQITIDPVDLDTDELSKIWSTFFQAPYSLSLAYRVMAVVIEGEDSSKRALPVREVGFGGVTPFEHQPVVEKVMSEEGATSPILVGTPIRIVGRQLQGPNTRVKIGDLELLPVAVSANEIHLSLAETSPDLLKAGIQGAQVLHYGTERNHSEDHVNVPVMSNTVPFVLAPTVTDVTIGELEGIDDDPRSGLLQVSTQLPVGVSQKVVIALNEWSLSASPNTYLFECPERNRDTRELTIPIRSVVPGEYLVRLQIDGADSLLGVDSDPTSKTFNWFVSPRVIIA
ncbi:MAG: DUF4255 domain-containing protein [Cyanobacteria bacterium J06643_4]